MIDRKPGSFIKKKGSDELKPNLGDTAMRSREALRKKIEDQKNSAIKKEEVKDNA